MNEGFEQGSIVDWQALSTQTSALELATQKSHTGTYFVRGAANSEAISVLERPLNPIVDGAVTVSTWVLSDGSSAQVLSQLNLGDALQLDLIQKDGMYSVLARQSQRSRLGSQN